jgi:hypothetical protein
MSSDRRSRLLPALVTVVVLVIALGVAQSLSLLPHFSNPVKEEEVDRTGPAVLQKLSDLSDYHASKGEFQVIVDIEKDVRFIPGVIAGERTTYQAYGSADGVVDLSGLDSRAVIVTDTDATTKKKVVTIVVPKPTLSDVTLDVKRSKVIAHDRGLANRVGDFFKDNPDELEALQEMAVTKLDAAAKESDLLERAETNTRKFLTDLAERAGADEVIVKFQDPEDPSTSIPSGN